MSAGHATLPVTSRNSRRGRQQQLLQQQARLESNQGLVWLAPAGTGKHAAPSLRLLFRLHKKAATAGSQAPLALRVLLVAVFNPLACLLARLRPKA